VSARVGFAIARILVALLAAVAIAATLAAVAAKSPINPFNFFGYFTIQSNLLDVVVLLVGGARLLRRTPPGTGWTVVRWALTDFMVVVGLVYALLLAPTDAAGGVPLPWANTVVHVVTPAFALLDWFLAPDRLRTPLRLTWVLLLYPAVWLTVVLVRGATDGWVPYPFLDPRNGYALVAGMSALVALAFVAVGLVLRLADRVSPRGDLAPAPA
jgi:hypothetical protein